jgi:hypothetical protein
VKTCLNIRFFFLRKAFGVAPPGQESTSETNGSAVTSDIIDTGDSDSTRQPSLEKTQNEGIFIGGAETPVLYRSRTKLKRMAAGRLYSLEEADTLGMEEPPFYVSATKYSGLGQLSIFTQVLKKCYAKCSTSVSATGSVEGSGSAGPACFWTYRIRIHYS